MRIFIVYPRHKLGPIGGNGVHVSGSGNVRRPDHKAFAGIIVGIIRHGRRQVGMIFHDMIHGHLIAPLQIEPVHGGHGLTVSNARPGCFALVQEAPRFVCKVVVLKGSQQDLIRIQQHDNGIVVRGVAVRLSQMRRFVAQRVFQPVQRAVGFVEILVIDVRLDNAAKVGRQVEAELQILMIVLRVDLETIRNGRGKQLLQLHGGVVAATRRDPCDPGVALTGSVDVKHHQVALPILKARASRAENQVVLDSGIIIIVVRRRSRC
mmetsp:Transcript_3551/g.9796  ORF Transcript_3551/g.9796 Transcript_3551/m.9796 type:complete len:264 (-) Transcript_3551:542-1333(-)